MSKQFLLYGSYGFTGSLIADQAVQLGLQPILSGRNALHLKEQAAKLGMEYIPISLDDRISLDKALKEVPLVINCAGPFVHTYKPIVEACLRTGRHYLDISGEIAVFEALAAMDGPTREAGVMLLPGVGFDVVPSDCLAAHLKERLPQATHLRLAISSLGAGSSRGTTMTSVEGLINLGTVRKDGVIVQLPFPGKIMEVDFGRGPRATINIPWGDVSTAYYSTGIPNIEVYRAFSRSTIRMLRLLRPFIGLLKKPLIQGWLKQRVMKSPPGPSAEVRANARPRLWGEVTDNLHGRAVSSLETPDGYDLSAQTSVAIVSRVLEGNFKPGFNTPSLAYGADFILEFKGVIRKDL